MQLLSLGPVINLRVVAAVLLLPLPITRMSRLVLPGLPLSPISQSRIILLTRLLSQILEMLVLVLLLRHSILLQLIRLRI